MLSEQRTDAPGLSRIRLHKVFGRVGNGLGPTIVAKGRYSVGEICLVSRKGAADMMAEVIGFRGNDTILTPYGSLDGVSHNSRICTHNPKFSIPVGYGLIGRVVDGLGQPIDGGPKPKTDTVYPAEQDPPNPMTRPIIKDVFEFGVSAIDGFLTCGIGQRMGIFAAAGGGKSTLLSMLARNSQCDRIIIALIGERGREVREFVEHSLGEEGMKRAVLVVSTSDRPAIEQVKSAYSATAIAEYFRDQGERVLLLVDSLTRFARAQRQIGLAAGEPPTRRGYPPSIFERLPSLLERGGLTTKGSITALYTVLVEGDDMNEPVADEVRSLLDGHIILSRSLAEKSHYPAIDVIASKSRIFEQLVSEEHLVQAAKLRKLLSKYDEIELLVQMGEYSQGSDRVADEAIAKVDRINNMLRQSSNKAVPFNHTSETLIGIGHGS